jgi:hypothetical protein
MNRLALASTVFALSCALADPALAEVVNLKCSLSDPKGGPPMDSWVSIDQAQNLMRVNGEGLPLVMTNESYASRSLPVAGFITVRNINRQTGAITVSQLSGSQVFGVMKGSCERSDPPPTKF